MVLSAETTVHVPADVLVQELQGEAVLLNLKSGQYFGLDAVGTRMWTLLTTAGSYYKAYEQLLVEYEVEGDQLERDLQTLVARLVELGLLEVSSA